MSYTYHADGTLASKLDANGNTETYTYDAYGRLTGIPGRNQTYTYDTRPANDTFCVSTPGQPLTLQSAAHLSLWGAPASGSLTATYALDAMQRPPGLSDNWTRTTWGAGVTYNAANQMTHDGQIASTVDAIKGETTTYTYDALKRLATANGLNWGETYGYDGFGNLTQMQPSGTAGAPSLSVSVDAATNRILPSGVNYDNNGNVKAGFGAQRGCYTYAPQNLRVYSRDASGDEKIYFYGADGKKLATYTYTIITYNGNPEIHLTHQSENVYFAARLLSAEGNAVRTDLLGSVRSTGVPATYNGYYPYGGEYTATANDTEKYATYTRDTVTGLDYAMNRYYSSQWGRFLSPDPSGQSITPQTPQSWNRYAYVSSNPISNADPSGLEIIAPPDPGVNSNPLPSLRGADPPCQELAVMGLLGDGLGGQYVGLGDWFLGSVCGSFLPPSSSGLQAGGGAGTPLSKDCLNALGADKKTGMAVARAYAAKGVLQAAVKGTSISWTMLAAIGVRESGFMNLIETDGAGLGVGVFQITVSAKSGYTTAQASNLAWAAGQAAKILANNMATLSADFPNFNQTQLLQATAASYNFGTSNISGNPNTIDVGSAGGNYGSNVLGLMNCFQ